MLLSASRFMAYKQLWNDNMICGEPNSTSKTAFNQPVVHMHVINLDFFKLGFLINKK